MKISRLRKTAPGITFALNIGIALFSVNVSLNAKLTHHSVDGKGIHPDALVALATASLTDRITRGIDHSPARGNVHGQDGSLEGKKPYTAAIDLSTKNLTDTQIKQQLARLATLGFIAWYRMPGHDGWPKKRRPHIHAVWVACHLKPRLQRQVASWLAGRNGLALDCPYAYWQPRQDAREAIRRSLGAQF